MHRIGSPSSTCTCMHIRLGTSGRRAHQTRLQAFHLPKPMTSCSDKPGRRWIGTTSCWLLPAVIHMMWCLIGQKQYSTDRIVSQSAGDFGYVVQHEYFHRSGESEPYQQYRTTMLFRFESGEWKLFHRHADSQVVFQGRH